MPDDIETEIERIDGAVKSLGMAIKRHTESINELEQTIDELQERVQELEDMVLTDLDALDYEAKSKSDKIREIHQYLIDEAKNSPHAKASANYTEIRALFNGQASPGHAYDLMEAAGDAVGFNYDERSGAKNRITVDADVVKENGGFRGANKTTS